MSINIQTEFNIGDKVWVPDYYEDWHPLKNECEIIYVEVIITSDDKRIFYTIKDCNGRTDRYPSKMCFKSYEQCKQWCEKN